VLADYSRTRPQIVKEMIVDYILYLRDEKPGRKLSRTSVKVHLAAILHFFPYTSIYNLYKHIQPIQAYTTYTSIYNLYKHIQPIQAYTTYTSIYKDIV
jgi:hypothetical protein